jgi:hypothetical protein
MYFAGAKKVGFKVKKFWVEDEQAGAIKKATR